jgi:hypothetical protein
MKKKKKTPTPHRISIENPSTATKQDADLSRLWWMRGMWTFQTRSPGRERHIERVVRGGGDGDRRMEWMNLVI